MHRAALDSRIFKRTLRERKRACGTASEEYNGSGLLEERSWKWLGEGEKTYHGHALADLDSIKFHVGKLQEEVKERWSDNVQ